MPKAIRRFDTTVLFEMATGNFSGATSSVALSPVISHVFPGIDYWQRQQKQIIKDRVAPEISKQHPRLADFKTAAQAVAVLGGDLPVRKVQRCDGFEWMIPKAAPHAA
jgi:hypothetical protein